MMWKFSYVIILGELFAKCPVDGYPGVAVEQVLDSSRYFVLRLQDDGGKIFTLYWMMQ